MDTSILHSNPAYEMNPFRDPHPKPMDPASWRDVSITPLDTISNFLVLINKYCIHIGWDHKTNMVEFNNDKAPEEKYEHYITMIKSLCILNNFPTDNIEKYAKFIGYQWKLHELKSHIKELEYDALYRKQKGK